MEHTNEPHPGNAPEPAIDEFEQNMERVFRLRGVKSPEYVNVYTYTGVINDPAIYALMTSHFIEIDALLGPRGERRSEYTGERMVTKNLGLTIPGRAEIGWEKIIASNFLIIDKVLGELQVAGERSWRPSGTVPAASARATTSAQRRTRHRPAIEETRWVGGSWLERGLRCGLCTWFFGLFMLALSGLNTWVYVTHQPSKLHLNLPVAVLTGVVGLVWVYTGVTRGSR